MQPTMPTLKRPLLPPSLPPSTPDASHLHSLIQSIASSITSEIITRSLDDYEQEFKKRRLRPVPLGTLVAVPLGATMCSYATTTTAPPSTTELRSQALEDKVAVLTSAFSAQKIRESTGGDEFCLTGLKGMRAVAFDEKIVGGEGRELVKRKQKEIRRGLLKNGKG